MSREKAEVAEEAFWEQFDKHDANHMSSLSEDYYYATHPKERPWLMDDVEVARIIKDYQSLISTQNQNTSNTSGRSSL